MVRIDSRNRYLHPFGMLSPGELEALLKASFPDAKVRLVDLTGGQDHYELRIASAAFSGLSRIRQHRLVYQALGPRMGAEVHALGLQTLLPEDWKD